MIPEAQSTGRLPAIAPGTGPNGGRRSMALAGSTQWYGWDSQYNAWHGPNEVSLARVRPGRLAKALRNSPGPSWYGPVSCSASGEQAGRFFAVIHRLADCAVAMVYCGESRTGPVELITVVPANRRHLLRPDFAFELVAFASFLGAIGGGACLPISEGVTTALADALHSDSLVFSICSGRWPSDVDYVLSRCVERIAVAMLDWVQGD